MNQDNISVLIKSINWHLDRKRDFNTQVLEEWTKKYPEITNEIRTAFKKETLRLSDFPEIIQTSLEGILRDKVEINQQIKKFLSRYQEVEELADNPAIEAIKAQVLGVQYGNQGVQVQNTHQNNVMSVEIRSENLNIDTFSGQDEDINDWFDDFETIAKANRWTDETKLERLPCYLKGTAKQFWKNMSKEIPRKYTNAKRELLANFAPKRNYEDEYLSIRQGNTETVTSFAYRLKSLARRALNMEPSDEQLTNRFKKGLLREIKNILGLLEADSFNNYVELAKKAEQAAKEKEEVEIQKNAMSYSKRFQERRSRSKSPVENNEFRSRSKSPVGNNGFRSRRATPGRNEIICHNCGKSGHIAKMCRLRRNMSPSKENNYYIHHTIIRWMSFKKRIN